LDSVGGTKIGSDGAIWFATRAEDFGRTITGDGLQFAAGGESDGFLVAMSPDLCRVEFATFLGGESKDTVADFAFGPNGEIYVVGSTMSRDFPATAGAIQDKPQGREDGFVLKLVPRPTGVETRVSQR
jgi:hypothetical protein